VEELVGCPPIGRELRRAKVQPDRGIAQVSLEAERADSRLLALINYFIAIAVVIEQADSSPAMRLNIPLADFSAQLSGNFCKHPIPA
jgi:hypothetical protein